MIKALLQTDSDYVNTFLRIIAEIIVFPYGMQKLFGWSSAPVFGLWFAKMSSLARNLRISNIQIEVHWRRSAFD